jgi:hypothetical protein
VIAAPGPIHPWPIGPGPRYRPTAVNAAVAAGRPVGTLTCRRGGETFAVHVELFAARRVIVVPRGIGKGPGGCTYPLRTDDPTGVVQVRRGRGYVLGDLFRIWGRRLGRSRLLTFRGPVAVFVGGRRFLGDPRRVPLRRHAEIVIELGARLAPHSTYVFPKGRG